jgi:hypothetical protein
MPMAHVRKIGGENDLYHIAWLDHGPGGGGGGVDPGYGQGRPGMRPDQGLPGSGAHPGNRPPGSGGGIPDHELPDTPPPQLAPGYTLVLVREGQSGKWSYAALAPGSPPPRPLPGPPPHGPGPGDPNRPDQGLPGAPPQYPSGQPVPPTATPR